MAGKNRLEIGHAAWVAITHRYAITQDAEFLWRPNKRRHAIAAFDGLPCQLEAGATSRTE